jgi:DNA modification methylase
MNARGDCRQCGAVRVDKQLGLEPTPEEYVGRMVEVFREVRRVLRADGVCWLNLGDSYASGEVGRVDSSKYTGSGGIANNKRPIRYSDKFATQKPRSERRIKQDTGLKHKDLVGIPWRVAFALQSDGWYLRQDIIWHKCLSGGAVVYARTAKGEMPMTVKDMVRLDPATVQLWDGEKWNQAVTWEPSPADGSGIEFELRNGQRIGCTAEHRWPTSRGLLQASDVCIGDVFESCRLPEPANLRTPTGLPDDDIGWFVGLYIAEGSQSDGTIQIASHAAEIKRFERVRSLALAYDGYATMNGCGGNSATINVNSPVLLGILNAYVSGRTAHDKHLSPRCWKRSDGFLRAVMDGYLSGDGHLRENGRWVLGFCQNDSLASELRVLAARIGASVRLRRAVHTMGNRKFPGWRGSLYFNPAQRKKSDYEVVAIRRSRARMFWDISLANEPHTFALGCGVLTHNSNPMPESVRDRCTKAHEYIFLLSKSARYWWDAGAMAEPAAKGAAGSLFNKGKTASHQLGRSSDKERDENGTRNRRSVWTVSTRPYKGAHFATFPPKLIEPCILAGCPEQCCSACGAGWVRVVERTTSTPNQKPGYTRDCTGRNDGERPGNFTGHESRTLGWHPACKCNAGTAAGIVLDPFAGSGTTLAVARKHRRNGIGIELNPAYVTLAEQRINSREYDPADPEG